MTPDPAGLGVADPGDPQSWNRYSYAANDPANLNDPSGLVAEDEGDFDSSFAPSYVWHVFMPHLPLPRLPIRLRGSGVLPGEGSLNWPLGPSPTDILGQILSGNYSAFGVPTLGDLMNKAWILESEPVFPEVNRDMYCGIGYHCDRDDIAEGCMLAATMSGFGLDDLNFYTVDRIWDKLRSMGTGPGVKALAGQIIGRKGRGIILKNGGRLLTGWAVYDFGRKGWKRLGECLDRNDPVPIR
jgi:hypothetical protein